jgi:hypothetical protein
MWLVVWETHRPSGGGRRRQCQRGRRCLTPLRAQDGRADALCARLEGCAAAAEPPSREALAALLSAHVRAQGRVRRTAAAFTAAALLEVQRRPVREFRAQRPAPCANSAHKDPARKHPRAARRGAAR